MKIFAPDYYRDFKCSAGNCKHSCCIGWEIDIDEDTANDVMESERNFYTASEYTPYSQYK